jgi:hypothetical protein
MPAAVHKEMNRRAQQENDVWQNAQNVSAVFGPQEKRRDGQQRANADPITRMTGQILMGWSKAAHFLSP